MRLLLDSCVWGPSRVEIERAGHDVEWTGTWHENPGDDGILRRAHAGDRVLVTLDKDFGGLATLRGIRHPGII